MKGWRGGEYLHGNSCTLHFIHHDKLPVGGARVWAETVMKSLTAIIQSSVRSGDLVARLSMNELGIFLPGAAAGNALDVAQRIRSRVAASSSANDGTDLPLSLKLGGTFFDGEEEFNTVRQLASEAAYDATDDETIALSQYR